MAPDGIRTRIRSLRPLTEHLSGWQDSNLRPLPSEGTMLTKLHHTQSPGLTLAGPVRGLNRGVSGQRRGNPVTFVPLCPQPLRSHPYPPWNSVFGRSCPRVLEGFTLPRHSARPGRLFQDFGNSEQSRERACRQYTYPKRLGLGAGVEPATFSLARCLR